MALIIDGSGNPISSAGSAPGGAAAGAGGLIKETTTDTFMEDVIQTSQTTPVIVDFWAPWCGPCKTLGPALERAVKARNGAVRMVKINVDENQELAAQFRVQSIPTVYAFKGGQPVDGFMGALSDSQIKSFIDKLTGGAADSIEDALAEAAALFDAGDAETALGVYQQIMAQDQGNPKAIAGVLRCQVALGGAEEVKAILGQLPPEITGHADIQALRTSLELAERAGDTAEITTLQARLEADPADHQARVDLALALFGLNRAEEAVDQLLEVIRRDRTWNDDGARKELLKLFEALGHVHPVTVAGRRKLSSILFS